MVWDPARITPLVWADAVEFYRRIEDRNDDFRPMRVLAEHIAAQSYAATISGATSGTALLIAPRTGGDWVHDSLKIDVDLSGTIRFVRHRLPPARPDISSSEARTIVETFEGFLRKAKWG